MTLREQKHDRPRSGILPGEPSQTFQVDALPVQVYATQKELAQDAARTANDYLKGTLTSQESVRIILATGNS